MSDSPHPSPTRGRSRPGSPVRLGILVVVLAIVIYLLTAHWLHVADALPYVFVAAMLVMHLFGHGGHGGHGGDLQERGAGDVR
ncbi:Protein of uncharacterised function (DUF2933) [Kocuria rosea]|uniref:DUF2933 domain-containing protein n=1 Tax=Kocuria rosea TaxID=1275 RepID=UPI000F71668E|nr:DUF2933 domain-containing protein [Kocuria rosea]VEH41173.1 Protein of uncharacterised function (DUF2933) [Kocuria rosea]